MSIKVRDSRGVIAAIRHDLRAGNIERARRFAAELMDGRWSDATPQQIEIHIQAVEAKLTEAGL